MKKQLFLLKQFLKGLKYLTLVILLFSSQYVISGNKVTMEDKQSQQNGDKIKITGLILDKDGEAIIGANVVEKGTSNGTVTDSEGKFSMDVSDKAVLVVNYIGYMTQEVNVGNRRSFNIRLDDDTKALEEVVVIGYGTKRKSDVTTSVASATAANLKDRSSSNFGEALAGQLAGVQIQQTNGMPGDEGLIVRVRGTASITQSNEPLYVLDGYPMESSAFRLISPQDIESIQVLKDASSTAIYGSRGANGVVLITTKKGQLGKATVRLNTFVGIQQCARQIKMMNRDQYIQWFMDGRNQAWLDAAVIAGDPDKSPHKITDSNARRQLYSSSSTLYEIPDGTGGYKYNFNDPASVAQMEDNNWQDLLFRDAPLQQYDLSVSGGTDVTRYVVTGSYSSREGIVIGTDYQRFNFRTSISSKITKNFTIEANLAAYYASGNEINNGKDAPLQYALNLPPIYPVKNSDGTYGSQVRNPEIAVGDVANPISIAENISIQRKRYQWYGTIAAEWEIIKDLKYRIAINGGMQDNRKKFYQPSYVDLDASKAPRPAQAYNERNSDGDWVIENTLNYNKTFAQKHALTFLLGYTTQEHHNEYMYGEARGFPNDNIMTLNAGTMYNLNNTESDYSMISYLGRVSYAYDNRYLLTATLRSDGSSRFGKNNKWGKFPTVSAGWRISQETFMRNVKQISDLKIRAGYGVTGNNRIGDYSAIGLLSTGYYPTGDALRNMVNPNTMQNTFLSWEKTREYNIGLELGLFNNRIKLETDFYDSQSMDLLLNVPVPRITGYDTQMQNVGKVQNRGMEYTLSTKNLIDKFKWSTDFNISFNKNKVLEVGPDGRPIYGSAANASNAFITMPGYPIASFWGYVYEGVYMTQEELDGHPHLAADKIGDGKYKDVDDNKIMNSNDKAVLGNNQPIFIAGLNNSFSYKNFSLDFQLTSSYGAHTFSFWKRMCGIYHGDRNAIVEQVNRWRSPEEPGDGIHFRATRNPTGWQRDPSSAWVQDASYLRLRNVTFAYDIDKKIIQKIGISGLRLYCTGSNLYTWTKYVGYDPENSSESGLARGGDYIGYPSARTFIVGANITF